jgi:hypothetical protein
MTFDPGNRRDRPRTGSGSVSAIPERDHRAGVDPVRRPCHAKQRDGVARRHGVERVPGRLRIVEDVGADEREQPRALGRRGRAAGEQRLDLRERRTRAGPEILPC